MSDDLIAQSEDLKALADEGFELEIRNGFLFVHSVPYVNSDRRILLGSMFCAIQVLADGSKVGPPADHTMFFTGETPCHKDGSPNHQMINNSNKIDHGNGIVSNHYFSAKQDGNNYANFYYKVVNYEALLSGPARAYDQHANARTGRTAVIRPDGSPFKIPDTLSSRYEIGAVTSKLLGQSVAIVGLGGTGSYVLDLVAKTHVAEIHIYDDDQFLSHNIFRTPAIPRGEDVKGFPTKVGFHALAYDYLRTGIVPHAEKITEGNVGRLFDFDFVFVCVDHGPSRRLIAKALFNEKIPFIDVGIGIGREGDELDGVVRTTMGYDGLGPWEKLEEHLDFAEPVDDDYEAAIQIAEVNSLNACLAVLRWKRYMGVFRDSRREYNSNLMLEGNSLSNRVFDE